MTEINKKIAMDMSRRAHRDDIIVAVRTLISELTDETVGYGRIQVLREIRNILDDESDKLSSKRMRYS